MRINELQINGFGKLSNKKIKLEKNINIIYGKNESGKSTLLGFIKSIFFGVSKNKNGKDISEYERFIPWKSDSFSGKVFYELDNGEEYEVYRDFKKKNPIIYDSKKQDISLNYSIDKNKGINFIYDQIKVDEDILKNTVIVNQNDVKIDKDYQSSIIQRISNIISSGDENISYKDTLERINRMQLENVGTERTREKPINLVNDKIEKLKRSKEKIDTYRKIIEENDLDVKDIENEINLEDTKVALYRVIKESNEKSKIKNSEIDIIKNIRDENLDKIGELDNKIDKDAKEKIKKEKKSSIVQILSILLFLIISIICFAFKLNKIIPIVLLVISGSILVFEIISKIKFNINKNKKLKELEELENKIEQEIKILRNNIKIRQNEIDTKYDEIKDAENEVNRLVMNKFENVLDSDLIEKSFELENNELDRKISDSSEKINNLNIEKGAKQTQKELMQEELNNSYKLKEEFDVLESEKEELMSLNNSYNLAKECLESAYKSIKNSLSPEFMNKLCDIVYKISNGKYKDVNFTDPDGLTVQIWDGRYIPIERLSQGTIDQIYLALRFSSIDTISDENIPIILDETFAFFDDDRLKNILEFLSKEYKNRQVIIFTCSRRELDILNRISVDYNYVELEN